MRGLLMAGTLAGAGMLGALAPAAPSLDLWKTGDGVLSYHHLRGDCEALTHSFGRNAVWGLWVAPLADVEVAVAPAAEGVGAAMTFTCRGGAACIKAGAYRTTDGRLATHAIPFGSLDRARLFETAISDLRKACAAS
jgi:hypothetical protein